MKLFVLLFLIPFGFAEAFVVWTPNDSGQSLVLPQMSNESCDQAIRNYASAVNKNDELTKMVGGELPIKPYTCKETIAPSSTPFLLLLNEFDSEDTQSTVKSFRQAGADVFLLPVGATLRLNDNERLEFFKELDKDFLSVVALGGEDIDPELYHQPINGANPHDIHPTRDRLEIQLHHFFIENGSGIFYGLCRGHQLAAVSQGSSLIQDIPTQLKTPTEHRGGAHHPIQVDSASLLAKFVGETNFIVDSYHHEAVATVPAGWTLTAFEKHDEQSDRVIEALQSSDGRAVTFQFHPEWMASDDNPVTSDHAIGKKILKGMVDYVRKEVDEALCPFSNLFCWVRR